MSSIVLDDLNAHFREARNARHGSRVAPSTIGMSVPAQTLTQLSQIQRQLPTVGPHLKFAGVGNGLRRNEMLLKSANSSNANVANVPPEIRNPLLSLMNFYLPYDRKTLNQWIRYYFKFDPYVKNCSSLNGQFPISDFRFTGITDPAIERAFMEMKERCGLLRHAYEGSQEEEIIGEDITFWQWNEEDVTWEDYTILNPDRLEVREINWGSGTNAFYSLDPPEELKNLIRDPDPYVQDMLATLDPVVLEALGSNSRVPLDPFNVTSLMHKDHPYDQRGTSPIMPALKALMYKDKLIEAQYAIADQQITPVQLWKIGDPANGYMATDQQLNDFRNLLQSGAHSPNFAIVTHSAVNLDLIGYTGKLLPILPELEWVGKQIMIALNTNEAAITGAGPSMGAAVVPFKILQGRYQTKRDRRAGVYRQKLFKPFAEARGMWKTTKAHLDHRIRTKREPIVPGIEWNFKLDLTDNAQKLQYMMQLRDKSGLPMRAICEVMNLDYDNVKRWLKDEEGTVFDPVYQMARSKRGEQSASAQGLLDVHGGGAGGGTPPSGGGEGEEPAGDTEAAEGEGGAETPPTTALMRRAARRTNPAGELLSMLKVA